MEPKAQNVPSKSRPAGDRAAIDLTGQTLGDFRVVRRLGQGGMGQVFLAEQVSLKRKVALKLLRSELAADPVALERFKTEATAIAGLTHANIVQVYLIGESDGLHYMALEYVEGRNLREYLEKKGPPDLPLALGIMRQAAAALARAGEFGLVHRDIKPDNILLTRKAEVKVADFGLAKALGAEPQALQLTQTGVVMGTPLYMSPEQVSGKAVDCRSDLYSFGCTCFHMLTGQPPFRAATPLEVAMLHLQAEPPSLREARPDLPPGLHAIVDRLLKKDPAQRYATARELLRDIARLRESLPPTVLGTGALRAEELSVELQPAPTAPTPTSSDGAVTLTIPASWRRYLVPTAIAGSLLLALGIGAALAVARRGSERPTPTRAPDDVKQLDALLAGKTKREQALRDAAEQYLSPPGGNFTGVNLRAGFQLCLDLGIFYLDERRLEDADAFFTRLEKIDNVPPYRNLGMMGRAIVLALNSKARESHALFCQIVPLNNRDQPIRKLEKKGRIDMDLTAWFDPRLRFWLAEAMHYNARNGIADDDLPPFLRRLRQLTLLAEKRKG